MGLDITLAAERLYKAARLDFDRQQQRVDVALRDAQARRHLELQVIRGLGDDPTSLPDIAESILVGAYDGSGGDRHKQALARFRSGKGQPKPPTLTRFLDYAGRPSRWGDWLAAATFPPDHEGGLARILVQLELGSPEGDDFDVEIDPGFGHGAEGDKDLERSVRRAVSAALGYLRVRRKGFDPDVDRVVVVRVFRGGLPWPFERDDWVPTLFEQEQARLDHGGPSVGLAVALAVVRSFLPVWTTRAGPQSVATGDVRDDGSIELVGGVGDKADATAMAELPFIVPTGSLAGYDERAGTAILPAATLREAVGQAFNLVDGNLDDLLKQRPKRLFGRDADLRRVLSEWDAGRRDTPALVLVQGESGIGKTGLLSTAVAALIADQVPLLFVDASDRTPFETFVKQLIPALTPSELRSHVGEFGRWLGTVASDLERTHRGVFLPREQANKQFGPIRQAKAVADLMGRAARTHGHLTLVIDNLQSAKENDWRILRELLDPDRELPMKVLCAYRDSLTKKSDSEAVTMVHLRSKERVIDIELEPLTPSAVGEWLVSVAATLRGLRDRDRDALQRATGGRAWEMSLLSYDVSKLPAGALIDSADVLLAAGEVRHKAAIARKEVKEEPFVETLSRAAVFRSLEFDFAVLLAAGDLGRSELLGHLIGAQESEQVTRSESSPGRWRFAHEKGRQRFLDRVSAETQAQYQLAAGEALELLTNDTGMPPPIVDLAHHFVAALPWGPLDKAVRYKGLEAEDATRRLAYGEASDLRLQAVELLDEASFPPAQLLAEALIGAALAYSHLGVEPESKPYYRRAIEVARSVGATELMETAIVGFAGPPEDRGVFDPELIGLLEEATGNDKWVSQPSENRTRLYGRLMFERVLASRRQPENFEMPPVEDLLEQARARHDPLAMAWAINTRLLGAWPVTDTAQVRIDFAEEMLTAAAATGEKELEIWGYGWKAVHQLELGRRAESEHSIAELIEVAKMVHHGYGRWASAIHQPMFAHLSGRIEEASALADAAYALRSGSEISALWCGVVRMLCLREQGRIGEIEPMLTVARWMMKQGRDPSYEYDDSLGDSAWALMCCDLGRLDEAWETIRPYAAQGFRRMLRDPAWPMPTVFLAEACMALDKPDEADALYEILVGRAGEIVVLVMGVACLGAADRYLGLLAATAHRWDRAEEHFLEAVRMNEMVGSPLFVAHTQCDHAAMLVQRSSGDDLHRAGELVTSASRTADELGLVKLLHRAAKVAEEIERLTPGATEGLQTPEA